LHSNVTALSAEVEVGDTRALMLRNAGRCRLINCTRQVASSLIEDFVDLILKVIVLRLKYSLLHVDGLYELHRVL